MRQNSEHSNVSRQLTLHIDVWVKLPKGHPVSLWQLQILYPLIAPVMEWMCKSNVKLKFMITHMYYLLRNMALPSAYMHISPPTAFSLFLWGYVADLRSLYTGHSLSSFNSSLMRICFTLHQSFFPSVETLCILIQPPVTAWHIHIH